MTEQVSPGQAGIIQATLNALCGLTGCLCASTGNERPVIERICKATEEAELTLRGKKPIDKFRTKSNAIVCVKAALRACLHELEAAG